MIDKPKDKEKLLEDALDVEEEIQRARDSLLEPGFVAANLARDTFSSEDD